MIKYDCFKISNMLQITQWVFLEINPLYQCLGRSSYFSYIWFPMNSFPYSRLQINMNRSFSETEMFSYLHCLVQQSHLEFNVSLQFTNTLYITSIYHCSSLSFLCFEFDELGDIAHKSDFKSKLMNFIILHWKELDLGSDHVI